MYKNSMHNESKHSSLASPFIMLFCTICFKSWVTLLAFLRPHFIWYLRCSTRMIPAPALVINFYSLTFWDYSSLIIFSFLFLSSSSFMCFLLFPTLYWSYFFKTKILILFFSFSWFNRSLPHKAFQSHVVKSQLDISVFTNHFLFQNCCFSSILSIPSLLSPSKRLNIIIMQW